MGDLKVPVGLDISDADAVVGEVKDPKTFYAVSGSRKTGTMPTVALAAGSNAYPAGYHVGDGGGLDAVDTDLAVGNIKKDVVIFGLTGTYEETLAEDVEGENVNANLVDTSSTGDYKSINLDGFASLTIATKTLTFDAASLTFAAGWASINVIAAWDLRLYMGGVLMQTIDMSAGVGKSLNYVARDFKVLSGSQTCYIEIYNDNAGSGATETFWGQNTSSEYPAAIAVGSVKLA